MTRPHYTKMWYLKWVLIYKHIKGTQQLKFFGLVIIKLIVSILYSFLNFSIKVQLKCHDLYFHYYLVLFAQFGIIKNGCFMFSVWHTKNICPRHAHMCSPLLFVCRSGRIPSRETTSQWNWPCRIWRCMH